MTVASTPHLRGLGLVITIASFTAIAYATLLPEPGPSLDAHFCVVCGSLGGVDAFLNVLLFAPLGLGLALCGVPPKRAVLTMGALSVTIEIAQLLLIAGRDATIGDVLTNTFGGSLGFAASRYISILLRPTRPVARSLAIGWGAIWLAVQTISSFAFIPSIPLAQYYGELARSLGNFALFKGRVLAAGVDGIVIPNTAIRASPDVRRQLLSGATVAARVVPAAFTPDIAPIVRVVDSQSREILLLAQNRQDLVFAMRTGAAVLRLRSPTFALRHAFPAGGANSDGGENDILEVSGRYRSRDVRMDAQTGSVTSRNRIPVTASLGWTLVLPFQWLIEGTRAEVLISWIWIAVLLVPFGYWTFHLTLTPSAAGQRAAPTFFLLGSLAIVCAGLALAPYVFELSPTPVREWLGAAAGLLVGATLALRQGGRSEPAIETLG